jgi:RNA polymerase-binding transcription factor DksA
MQMEKLHERLCQRRDELRDRLSRVQADLRREIDLSDFADQAIQRSNDAVLRAITHTTESELSRIEVALQRIAEQRYHRCSGCGEDIGLDRLSIVPYTEHCLQCADVVNEAELT